MDASDNEGLGLSVAIYIVAVVGALAILAVPIYLMNAPQVYENPKLAQSDPLLNGPIIGQRVSTSIPVAMLQRQQLIDPAILAALNAKTRKAEVARPRQERQIAQQPTPRVAGTPMAEARQERQRPGFFLFNLFGG